MTDSNRAPGPLPPASLDALMERRDRFLAFLTRRVGPDLAEEILQDVFARSVERGDQLRDKESVVAWFFRALRNAVVDFQRRSDAARRSIEGLAAELQVAPPPGEQSGNVCRCVSSVLDDLRPEYRDSIRAVDLDGHPLRAFAAAAGLSPNAAAVRLHRARKALAQGVRATCGSCADTGCTDCGCAHEAK